MTEETLYPERIVKLARKFKEELVPPAKEGSRALIVIGGAPSSGKTTAARAMAQVSGSFHVQANSARHFFRDHGIQTWGENVHLLIREVVDDLLIQGSPVVVDGMVTEEKERRLLKDVAAENRVPMFFFALSTDPMIAEQRARIRYYNIKLSTFDDWRASPEKVEEYFRSIKTRAEVLEKNIAHIPDDIYGILRIKNDHSRDRLIKRVHIAWKMLEKHL